TTVDPSLSASTAIFDPRQWNRYGYVVNNPLAFVDPDGREPRCSTISLDDSENGVFRGGVDCEDPFDVGALRFVLQSLGRFFGQRIGEAREIASAPNVSMMVQGSDGQPRLVQATWLPFGVLSAESSVSRSLLGLQLNSEEQVGQLLGGRGRIIAGPGSNPP